MQILSFLKIQDVASKNRQLFMGLIYVIKNYEHSRLNLMECNYETFQTNYNYLKSNGTGYNYQNVS